jgi:hypothetical protein
MVLGGMSQLAQATVILRDGALKILRARDITYR